MKLIVTSVVGFILFCTAILFIRSSYEETAQLSVQDNSNSSTNASTRTARSIESMKSPREAVAEANEVVSFGDSFELLAEVQKMNLSDIQDYLNSPEFNKTYFHGKLHDDFINSLFSRYANLDPNGALDFLTSTRNPVRDQAFFPVFYQWALNDPHAAISATNSLKNKPYSRKVQNALIVGISRINPEWGLKVSEEHAGGQFNDMALWYLGKDDPQKALAREDLNSGKMLRVRRNILSNWIMNDPSALVNWLQNQENEVLRTRDIRALIGEFEEYNLDLTDELKSLVPDENMDTEGQRQ